MKNSKRQVTVIYLQTDRRNNGQNQNVLVSLDAHHILTEAFRNVSFKTDYVISIKNCIFLKHWGCDLSVMGQGVYVPKGWNYLQMKYKNPKPVRRE